MLIKREGLAAKLALGLIASIFILTPFITKKGKELYKLYNSPREVIRTQITGYIGGEENLLDTIAIQDNSILYYQDERRDNNGWLGFESKQTIAENLLYPPRDLELRDINGDGLKDIVFKKGRSNYSEEPTYEIFTAINQVSQFSKPKSYQSIK